MLKKITKDNFLTSISTFDISTLSDKDIDRYLDLSTLYRMLLNEYVKQIGLNKYEELIQNSELNFIPINDSQQDFYQYYNNSDLEYYYVRNNIYLEALNDEEKAYLERKLQQQDFSVSNQDLQFIANTFKKVISEHHPNMEEPFNTNYGPTSSPYFAQNNALVIGFRYDMFNIGDMEEEKFVENLERQEEYYYVLNEHIQDELKQKLDIPVSVIEYNENSIKKLKKNEEEKEKTK